MILYRDEHWLVVNKPAGLATHAGRPGELGAVEWLELHLDEPAHVVSRLDRATSGVLLLARDAAASGRAQAIHEEGTARKVYEFVSAVDPAAGAPPARWTCADPIDGKEAETRFTRLEAWPAGPSYRTLGPGDGRLPVLFRAEIRRGRRHQIRRHAAAAGLPILGDRKYGGARWPRLCLHCREVHWPELPEPVTAPAPPSFDALACGDGDARELGLALCRDRRGQWLPSITNALRIVNRDEIPGLPAAVDVYGAYFNAIWFDEDADPEFVARRLHPLLEQLMETWSLLGGVIRVHRRNPHQRQLVTEIQTMGQAPPERFSVVEHGLRYEINLLQTQHTGLFLDQRDTRRILFRVAAGKRLANLFAYTCSFSVVAAAAGAEVAFSVDVAKPCLSTGKANFAANDLTETGIGKFIQEDARKWLGRQQRKQEQQGDAFRPLDLVICDPPVFASSRDGGKFSVEKEWPALARSVADLLADGGRAVFANNHRGGNDAYYRNELEAVFREVVSQSPPLDYSPSENHLSQVRTYFCEK